MAVSAADQARLATFQEAIQRGDMTTAAQKFRQLSPSTRQELSADALRRMRKGGK